MTPLTVLALFLCVAVLVECQVTVPPGPDGGLQAAKAIEAAGMAMQANPGDMNQVHKSIGDIMDNIQAVILVNSPSRSGGYYGAPGPVNLHTDEDLGAAMFQGVGNGIKNAGTPGGR
ncbi:uncharacterized protein LOC129596538 [Paramacrobiotus metropolitanus]|uniref:uncharacterized protein LOC129596538 n=1 Tax=Paramacrobiotus metropolitanus TaxID=2943436 RepID=UPI0024458D8C|nr:uncharacterized protein LOC129596538 [Paramacrobiotus metropolitanus]